MSLKQNNLPIEEGIETRKSEQAVSSAVEANRGKEVEPKFRISLFQNERDNTPQPVELTFHEFVQEFNKFPVRKMKVGGKAWSPAAYPQGATRGAKYVEFVTMAVIDADDAPDLEKLKAALDGFTYLIHTSYSHTAESPKLRIVLPLKKPVLASQWPSFWPRLNQLVGGISDQATKDASRLYYLPAKANADAESFCITNEGKYLSVEDLPVLDEPLSKPKVNNPLGTYSTTPTDSAPSFGPDTLKPLEALQEVLGRCKFMAWASAPENQGNVSEPLWKAMISNAVQFENSDDWIHRASCHHPEYSPAETESKIDRSRRFGPPTTCKTIREGGFKGCPNEGCKLQSGLVTKAPAGLWIPIHEVVEIPAQHESGSEMQPEYPPKFKDVFEGCFDSNLIFANGSFLGYKAGVWRILDDGAEVRRPIAEFLGKKATPKGIDERVKLLKDFRAVRDSDMNCFSNLIGLRNGTLNLDTFELQPHSPENYLTNGRDIDWDPNAKAPRFMQFLDEIFLNDQDKAEKIDFIQEFFGYCLTPDTSQHKFVWMVGGGGNGKSVLLGVLTKLVGRGNVSHASIERMEDKYVRAELEGKLVNISSEMSAEATMADSYLKAIVSGDIIEAERKFKPSFSFKPYVRLVAATNHLPKLLDLSEGFFRRAVILTFNRQFKASEQDPALEGKLNEELPGILVWAVEGLKRLRSRGKFVIPSSSALVLAKYRLEADPVALFADEYLAPSTEFRYSKDRIFSAFEIWRKENGFKQMTSQTFNRRMAELGFEDSRTSDVRYWNVVFQYPIEWYFSLGSPERIKRGSTAADVANVVSLKSSTNKE